MQLSDADLLAACLQVEAATRREAEGQVGLARDLWRWALSLLEHVSPEVDDAMVAKVFIRVSDHVWITKPGAEDWPHDVRNSVIELTECLNEAAALPAAWS